MSPKGKDWDKALAHWKTLFSDNGCKFDSSNIKILTLNENEDIDSFNNYIMDYFDKYKRCHRCHEDGKGTYIEELGYALCNGRGDYNPPCIKKYELEKRFEDKLVISFKSSEFSIKIN